MVQVSGIGVEDRTHEDPGAYVLVRSLCRRKHAGCVKHEINPFSQLAITSLRLSPFSIIRQAGIHARLNSHSHGGRQAYNK